MVFHYRPPIPKESELVTVLREYFWMKVNDYDTSNPSVTGARNHIRDKYPEIYQKHHKDGPIYFDSQSFQNLWSRSKRKFQQES